MFKFFRNIRRTLLLGKHSQTKSDAFSKPATPVGRYLLYAIGEIILVVIGILIALQIDTYSDQKKERKQEVSLLANLSQEVALDIQQIENNTALSNARLKRLDSLIQNLRNPDSINASHFIRRSYEFVFDNYFKSNSGIFDEAVSSGKMSFIQNELLRQAIFNYYRNAKETYTDGTTRQITDELITPLLVEEVYLNQEGLAMLGLKVADITSLENLNVRKLAQNKDYWKMVLLKFGGNREQIIRWGGIQQRAHELKKQIDQELQKL